jgi:diguanylate cyclase (GGDEF)-like protein
MSEFLLVEDDVVDRELVRRALSAFPNEVVVHEAKDGETGLAMLHDQNFDCILLDYQLPDLNGIEFLDTLRSRRMHPDVPIVMLTGMGSEHVAVEAMKRGVLDYLPKQKVTSPALVQAVSNAIEKATCQRRQADKHQRLQTLALYDSLTGLGNRNLFQDQLDFFIAWAGRNKMPFALMAMDLNKFKPINDCYGHLAGDIVLAEIGRRLRDVSRQSDLLFRLGGDEFAALMSTGATEDGVLTFASRIEDCLRAPITAMDYQHTVSISIGVSFFPVHGNSAEQLLQKADVAMYSAKKSGGGCAIAAGM